MVPASPPVRPFKLQYHSLRSVTSPEDTEAGRKRYCGIAPARALLGLDTSENVRGFLGRDEDGNPRKATLVNKALLDTIERRPEYFALLNSGVVIVAREAKVDDPSRTVLLNRASIINGAQTTGVLRDYFAGADDEDETNPSVNFELLVMDDEELIADVSIARNFQNQVKSLSIYGRQGRFEALEAAMQRVDPKIRLRKQETDFSDEFLDTEKLIQVLTAIAPADVPLPSAVKRKERTLETQYRVYAYRHRSRCLKDFAEVMDDCEEWAEAHKMFLDLAVPAWKLYWRLKGEQAFSPLHCVRGAGNGTKVVARDGVPDGIVFPMLSALSGFMKNSKEGWQLRVPKNFPWKTFFGQAMAQEKSTAGHNPNTMGKLADCYIALHGSVEMFVAVSETA